MSIEETSSIALKAPSAELEIALRDDERQRCEVWTRVMGYHRPTTSFNVGKQGEFAERKYFRESPALRQENP
ncbi:anaerobic ribonucleoside-triphosphate reductase [Acidithiobacillus sp.]